MSQDLGHTKVILSSRGITNHCIPARDGRSKKCLKTKLDPGYTQQKSFSQFTPGQGLKGSRGQKVPRGSQGVIRDVLACKGVPEGQGGRLEGPVAKGVKGGTRGLSGCLWGPKGPREISNGSQGVAEDVSGVLGNQQGVDGRCHESEEEPLKDFHAWSQPNDRLTNQLIRVKVFFEQ